MEIKKWQDFPKEGVTFIDINNILQSPEDYARITFKMSSLVNRTNPNQHSIILSPESRGHLFASVVSRNLHLPLIQLRKEGKYPVDDSIEIDYNTEYEENGKIFAPLYDYANVQKAYVIDDLCATGQSFNGIKEFLKAQNPNIEVYYVTVIDLAYLHQPIDGHNAPLLVESADQEKYIER